LFEPESVDRFRRKKRPHDRRAPRRREKQCSPEAFRRHGVGDEERARERERHGVEGSITSDRRENWRGRQRSCDGRDKVNYPTALLERTLPIAMLSLALVAVPVLVLEPEGLPRLRGLERELDDVTAENADLRREVERLRVEVGELRDDPAAVERIARGELGMVRKSEIVFQFGK
jgi:cell division protein FtsB